MGMSASAYLWYGVDLQGSETRPYDPDTFETIPGHPLVDIRDAEGDEVSEGNPDYEYDYPDLGHWLALQKGESDLDYKLRSVLEKAAPVELAMYGYMDGYTSYALVLKGVGGHAYSYDIEEIDPLDLHISNLVIDTACAFCVANNLPDFRQAKWLLAASYG